MRHERSAYINLLAFVEAQVLASKAVRRRLRATLAACR
jgi:hypothetical protein